MKKYKKILAFLLLSILLVAGCTSKVKVENIQPEDNANNMQQSEIKDEEIQGDMDAAEAVIGEDEAAGKVGNPEAVEDTDTQGDMNAAEDTDKQDDIDNNTNNEIGSELGSDNIYDIDTVLAILSQDVASPYRCELDSVDDDGNYLIHIYEVVDNGDESHTATLDWITVNPTTGDCETFFGETFNIEDKR